MFAQSCAPLHLSHTCVEPVELFRRLAENIPQLVWLALPDGRLDYVNQRWLEFTGLSMEESHGWSWKKAVHADDLAHCLDQWTTAIDNATPYQVEVRLRRHDGLYRWFLMRGEPIFAQEQRSVCWLNTCTDITDHKNAEQALRESEERFRSIVEGLPEMICRFRPDGTILFVNDAYASNRGTTAETLIQAKFWDFIDEVDREGVRALLDSLNPETPEVRIENRFETVEGVRWTLWTNRGLKFDAEGRATEVQAIGIDITARKQAEEALRDADRRKDEFLATLAHELRNPLAPIRTGLELIKMVGPDLDKLEEIRSTMEQQTEQLIALVDDLLDVSRITRGKLELRKAEIKLADVVKTAIETARPLIDDARHQLTIQMPGEPIYLDADPHRLSQVISNLLNNAAKYTPDQGRIWLVAERQEAEVLLTVKDTGLGIPIDMHDRVFEMFTQLDRPLEKGYTGLGIGLTLVKSLVEMHNGTIEVHSNGHNQGSEFRVRLPLHVKTDVTKSAAPSEAYQMPRQTCRVLVADDNVSAAEMMGMMAKMLGFDVRVAHDGQKAVEVAGEFLPDIILMDLGMPKMNGYEAAQSIRQHPWGEQIRLVAVSGWGQEEDKARSKAAGFDDHLVKPAEPAKLKKLLSEVQETNR